MAGIPQARRKARGIVLANLNGPVGDIAGKTAAVAHGETVTLPSERKEITLDSNVLSRYVGPIRCQMADR